MDDGRVELRVGMRVLTWAAAAAVGEMREIVAWPGIVRARYRVVSVGAHGLVSGEIVEVLDGDAERAL